METIKNNFPKPEDFNFDIDFKRCMFCNADVYDKLLPRIKSPDIRLFKSAFVQPGNYLMTKDIDKRLDEPIIETSSDSKNITVNLSAVFNFY